MTWIEFTVETLTVADAIRRQQIALTAGSVL